MVSNEQPLSSDRGRIVSASPAASGEKTSVGLSNSRYLALAGIFHVAVTTVIFALGRTNIFPGLFDRNGIGNFAADGPAYLADVVSLVNALKQTGIAGWASAPFPFHSKIYSLVFAASGPLVGFNILAAEPLNLLCYLAIILSVYKLGSEISGPRTGRIAAIIIALWPTLLLHTTQVLKDPLFIALLLGLICISACFITRTFSITRGLCTVLLIGGLAMFLWSLKPDVWALTLMVLVLAGGFLYLRLIRAKGVVADNLIGGTALLAIALGVPFLGPRFITRYHAPEPHPLLTTTAVAGRATGTTEAQKNLAVKPPSQSSPPLTKLRERITWARFLFVSYPGTNSNIDADVRLESWGEIVRYLPRATQIGLFAPFPNMWLGTGAHVGRAGRALSGFETLLIYFLISFSAWSLWHRRNQLAIWFLLTIATLSVSVLGLVAANVGALYRMRYPFWILLIIVGVDGARLIRSSGKLTRLLRR